jgi:diaminopimelate decarboxylase
LSKIINKNALYGNKFLNIKENELVLDGIKIKDLIEKYNTPSFVFLQKKIEDNIKKINDCFSSVFPNSQGFYSTKANYLPEIISIVKNQDFGTEIVGLPELKILKKIKFPFEKVIAGGPYLPNEFLTEIIKTHVKYLVIYDLDDIIRIQEIIQECGEFKQDILIRIQSQKYTGRLGIVLNEPNLKKLKELFDKCPNLQYKGILAHRGTQLNSIDDYMKNFQLLIENAIKIKKFIGWDTSILNIGGGFPNADSLKKNQLIAILKKFKEKLLEKNLNSCSIFYEPGRFIVGDTGFALASVIKYDKIHRTAFLDIGNNYIPKFMKSSLRFYNISKIFESPNKPIDFMGNIPSDQDILVKNYNFTPSIQTRDYILIANVGAYALTWSIRFPYPNPSIILIESDQIKEIHNRNSPNDFSIH